MTSVEAVVRAALAARDRAYAPYSGFRVGAALVTGNGAVFTGANVENASFGLTVCAERVALWTAIVAGATSIRLLVVIADTHDPVSPCGACRQVLMELAPDADVVMATVSGRRELLTVRELLPRAFTTGALAEAPSREAALRPRRSPSGEPGLPAPDQT